MDKLNPVLIHLLPCCIIARQDNPYNLMEAIMKNRFNRHLLPVLLTAYTVSPLFAAQISGQLKKWHKVTLTFDGPQSSETADPNPFLDYRLNVVFSHDETGKTCTMPGYFAADGDAAETSADSGDQWRVHFCPDQEGTWTWRAAFRKGKNIAVSDDAAAGESGGFMDGQTGSFVIGPTDKTGRDFRGKGMLRYAGKHHLQFAETGEYFLKCGADAPENFLAYADFDGDFKTDGHNDQYIKTWQAHIRDWKRGDPTWQDGKGKGIIGALNYLAAKGMNAFSFLTMNIGGDDRNVFPYIDYVDYERMDISRMDQWEIVFQHADRLGLFLHFKTQETENDQLLDGGTLGPERRLYYRELIARFGHHLALNWNLGEENTNTIEQIKEFCAFFNKHDPYRHPIVLHTYPDWKEKVYGPLLGTRPGLDGTSLQTNRPDFSEVHRDVLHWIRKSDQAGKPWVVACDEPGDAEHALLPDTDDPDHDQPRKNALWGTLMAGGAGCEFYFGYGHEQSDLTCRDWRSRDRFWDQCRHALAFFKDNNIPFWDMRSADELISNETDWCLAKPGQIYIVYLKQGGTAQLDLGDSQDTYTVLWYNPRKGGLLQKGTISEIQGPGKQPIGLSPSETEIDWAVLIHKTP